MQKIYSPFLISSPAHLMQFMEIKRQNPWWKMLLGWQRIPKDFPQIHMGSKPVPVVFFAKGQLTLFERQLDFRSIAPGFDNGARYENIQTAFSLDILYSTIARVERYQAPEPFIKYFNINWVRIILDDSAMPNDLLLSFTGSGTQMQLINQTNNTLFVELQRKTEHPASLGY